MTFSLEQNFPNPFNPVTSIEFTLSKPANATLKVFNLRGEQVAILLEKHLSTGTHKVNWNAGGLASGVCICIGWRRRIIYRARSSVPYVLKRVSIRCPGYSQTILDWSNGSLGGLCPLEIANFYFKYAGPAPRGLQFYLCCVALWCCHADCR